MLPVCTFLSNVFLSIGCGGIASVVIAWLIDIRNYRQTKKENECRFSLIMKEYVNLYKRLLFVAVNECHGLYRDKEPRSLEEWLSLLCDETKYSLMSKPIMAQRCERLSGTVYAIQNCIDRFRSQGSVLILSGYPNIENILDFFETQQIHCWGTLNLLSTNNYKDFCRATCILYSEFIKLFPEYVKEFPSKYNMETVNKWNS